MPDREIPETLAEWLSLWRVSRQSGNPYLNVGRNYYSVFRDRSGQGWRACVGRSFLGQSWPDPEAAKEALFELVRALSPDQLAALHAGDGATLPARQSPVVVHSNHDRDRDPPPEVLATFPRRESELRLELRSFEGHPFLALVAYKFGPRGRWQDKLISIRAHEAYELAEAIRSALRSPVRPTAVLPEPSQR